MNDDDFYNLEGGLDRPVPRHALGWGRAANELQQGSVPRPEDRAERDLVAFEQTLPNLNFRDFRAVDSAFQNLSQSVRDRSVSALERHDRVKQDISDLVRALPNESRVQLTLLKDLYQEVRQDAEAEQRLSAYYGGNIPRPGDRPQPTRPGDGRPTVPGSDAGPLPPLPPCPPGFDSTKWNDPNYHSFKYDVGRNLARIEPILKAMPNEELAKAVVESFLRTQKPVIEANGGKFIDVRNECIKFFDQNGTLVEIDTIASIGGKGADETRTQWHNHNSTDPSPYKKVGTPLTPERIAQIKAALTPEQLRNPLLPAEIRGGSPYNYAMGGGNSFVPADSAAGRVPEYFEPPLSGNGKDDRYGVMPGLEQLAPFMSVLPEKEDREVFAEAYLRSQARNIAHNGGQLIDVSGEVLKIRTREGTIVEVDCLIGLGSNENKPSWQVSDPLPPDRHGKFPNPHPATPERVAKIKSLLTAAQRSHPLMPSIFR